MEVCIWGRKVTCSAEADPGALAMPDLSHLNFNPAPGSKPNQLDRPTFIVRDRLNGRNRRKAAIGAEASMQIASRAASPDSRASAIAFMLRFPNLSTGCASAHREASPAAEARRRRSADLSVPLHQA